MKLHFIAIGGSAMHNLALALYHKGYRVTGSDDEIFEPSRSRLAKAGLLPEKEGWYPERITEDMDAIILGMHAKEDNPELIKAKEMKLKIYSYPEFLFEQAKDKKRVVIAGSHGKTSITAMVMHVLGYHGIDFDFMVGAQLEGFDVMVRISENAKIMVLEGDEYLTSPIDPRPKFHLYRPHIALITGIAWDHINVFPTFEKYTEQFRIFIDLIEDGGMLIWYEEDVKLKEMVRENKRIRLKPYNALKVNQDGRKIVMEEAGREYSLHVFGDHNLQNIAGAREVCLELGITSIGFSEAISSFRGASKRLQLISEGEKSSVYLDFAHAPSKLRATVDAMKGHFPNRKLVACMELHTYSSLSAEFLDQYRGAMDKADEALVYFNPHAIALKRLPEISIEQVKKAFGRDDLIVFNNSSEMLENILAREWKDSNLLLMSSGNFDGWDIRNIATKVTSS